MSSRSPKTKLPDGRLSGEHERLPGLFLNAIKAAIIATDLSGLVTYWNPFAEELYGWSSEEVL
ncbi:MAG TPA: PAS domain-containing protein, partial [Candidatus Acidoferrum sp.]|nr:PAS domain-containing protein [Candidatus Acidoferrum sp.]